MSGTINYVYFTEEIDAAHLADQPHNKNFTMSTCTKYHELVNNHVDVNAETCLSWMIQSKCKFSSKSWLIRVGISLVPHSWLVFLLFSIVPDTVIQLLIISVESPGSNLIRFQISWRLSSGQTPVKSPQFHLIHIKSLQANLQISWSLSSEQSNHPMLTSLSSRQAFRI